MCKKCSSELKVKPKREKVEKIIEREINGEKYIGTYNNYLKAVKEVKEKRKSRVRISYTRIYKIYVGMKDRCYNSNNGNYVNYGGRGIKICEEWLKDARVFYEWAINNGYKDNLSIDRIDVNGNYEPNNCRWITLAEQQRNKRTNLKITYQNKTQTLAEWSKELGVSATCISSRIKRGKTMEEVFYKGKLRATKRAKKENLKKDLKRERRKLAKVLNAIKLVKMYNSIGIKITEYRNK